MVQRNEQQVGALGVCTLQDYSLSMYVRQKWLDSRLTFLPAANHNSSMLKMGDDHWHKLWIPEVVFRNEKRAMFHHVSTDNRLMRVYDSGHVWHVFKLVTYSSAKHNPLGDAYVFAALCLLLGRRR